MSLYGSLFSAPWHNHMKAIGTTMNIKQLQIPNPPVSSCCGSALTRICQWKYTKNPKSMFLAYYSLGGDNLWCAGPMQTVWTCSLKYRYIFCRLQDFPPELWDFELLVLGYSGYRNYLYIWDIASNGFILGIDFTRNKIVVSVLMA